MALEIAGKKINGWWIVGGVGGLGIVIYLFRKGSLGSLGGSGSGSSSAIDPVTGLPASMDNQVDPATGLTYLAEAQQFGSVSAAEAGVQGNYQGSGQTAGAGVTSGFPTIYGSQTSVNGSAYANNSQWSQAVTQGLVSLGYNAQDVASALGLYFQGQPLGIATDGVSYLAIIQAAVAEFGTPPVGTYAILAPPSSPGGVGPTGSPGPVGNDTVMVPDVVGKTGLEAFNTLKAAGLHAAGQESGTAHGRYAHYIITSQNPTAGTMVAPGTVVTLAGKAPAADGNPNPGGLGAGWNSPGPKFGAETGPNAQTSYYAGHATGRVNPIVNPDGTTRPAR